MDNLTVNSIFVALVGAIGILFRLLVGHYESRIKALETENVELRQELHQRRATDHVSPPHLKGHHD